MEIVLRHKILAIVAVIGTALILGGIFGYREYKKRKALSEDEMSKFLGYGAMWMVDTMKSYKVRRLIHKILNIVGIIGITLSLLSSAYLLGRPSVTEEEVIGVQRRDVFLCLDVSYSLYDLNYDFVENLKEVVQGLNGDRIGISIFNSSSLLYMPLTDDKDFVCEKLDNLALYFAYQKAYMDGTSYTFCNNLTEKEQRELFIIDHGTIIDGGLAGRGSSLIGEGLANCLYDFPSLEDSERTRIIIMVTDNAQYECQNPIVEFPEASDLCAKNGVVLFGIFPPEEVFYEENWGDFDELHDEFQNGCYKTGGGFYMADNTFDTKGIISEIQSHEAMKVDDITEIRTYDVPMAPFIFIIIGILALAAARAGGAC